MITFLFFFLFLSHGHHADKSSGGSRDTGIHPRSPGRKVRLSSVLVGVKKFRERLKRRIPIAVANTLASVYWLSFSAVGETMLDYIFELKQKKKLLVEFRKLSQGHGSFVYASVYTAEIPRGYDRSKPNYN